MISALQRLVVLLAIVLVASGSVLVFSPLHTHDSQSPSKCSLNNLEAVAAEAATYTILAIDAGWRIEPIAERPAELLTLLTVAPAPGRAPPAIA